MRTDPRQPIPREEDGSRVEACVRRMLAAEVSLKAIVRRLGISTERVRRIRDGQRAVLEGKGGVR